jgi:hypothetical protein
MRRTQISSTLPEKRQAQQIGKARQWRTMTRAGDGTIWTTT